MLVSVCENSPHGWNVGTYAAGILNICNFNSVAKTILVFKYVVSQALYSS